MFYRIALAIFVCLALAATPILAGAAEKQPAKEAAKDPAQAAPKKVYGTEVGSMMKPFKLQAPLENKEYDSEKLMGKPTLLSFVQSACRICQNEVREMVDLYPSIKDKMNVMLVFLDVDTARLPKYAEAYNSPFPILHDGNAEVAGSVGIASSPATILLSADGKIAKKEVGYYTDMIKDLTTAKK